MFNFLIALILSLTCSVALAEGSSVAAVVNGEPITDLDVAKRAKLITSTSGIPNTPQSLKILKPQIIQMLIDEKLINQEANRIGVEAEQSEIDAAMQSLAERNNLSPAQFDGFIKQRGLDKEVFSEQVKHQVLWNEIVSTRIRPTISVTNQEIEENEESIKKSRKTESEKLEQLKLAEIVIFASDKNLDKQLQFAKKLSDDLRSGADFAKVAKEFSLSGSAKNGGEIGWVYFEQLAPELSMHLGKMGKGAISHPIVLQDGIHIVKVIDVKKKILNQNTNIDEEQVKEALMERKLSLAIKTYLNNIRKKAYIKIN